MREFRRSPLAARRQPSRARLCYNPPKSAQRRRKPAMPLESLLKLAETLKERIDVHRDTLGANEIRTRYALIDPLLRELGWDTSDPSAVVPEYSSGSGRADYALMSAGRPAIMVEAKKLGTPLRDDVLGQVLNYCMMEGTERFAVTDGARWDIYKTYIPETRVDQRRIVEFDLSADPPASVCLKALALWRPSVEAGSVAPAQTPVIGLDKPADSPPQPAPAPVTVILPPPDIQGDWHRLTDIKDTANRRPVEMGFPDNTRTELGNWVKLASETARWLSQNGHLTRMKSPIKASERSRRYILNAEPFHSDGKEFTQPHEANGFWVEGNTGAKGHIGNTVTVIERVGQDPSQFRVRFA